MAAFEHFLAFEFQGSHAEPSDSPISRLQGAASMHPAGWLAMAVRITSKPLLDQ